MPLRDHFRPPVENEHSWDELHGMWPAVIVQRLFPILPEGYVAVPRVHLVAAIEIVSPSNKDRPESRRAFVAKVAALLKCWRPVSASSSRRFATICGAP